MSTRHRALALLASATLSSIATAGHAALPPATADEQAPLAIRAFGEAETQSWEVLDGHHAFGIYDNSTPASEIRKQLPPGFELSSCLEHKAPGLQLVGDFADIILEAWEVAIPEHPDWGVVRMGAIATCVRYPGADLGYPAPIAAEDGYAELFGLPTAPQVLVLEGWTDSPQMKAFMEHYGMRPKLAEITIDDPVEGGMWTFDLTAGDLQLSGTFPTAQRNPEATGERQWSPCQPVKQSGHWAEWPKGSDELGMVMFENAVSAPNADGVDANTYACLGGTWTWNEALNDLAGPVRPAALAGSQPNDVGAFNRQTFVRHRIDRRGSGVPN